MLTMPTMLTILISLTTAALATAAPCPASFRIHPNGNTAYCLTASSLNASGALATV